MMSETRSLLCEVNSQQLAASASTSRYMKLRMSFPWRPMLASQRSKTGARYSASRAARSAWLDVDSIPGGEAPLSCHRRRAGGGLTFAGRGERLGEWLSGVDYCTRTFTITDR